MPLRLAAFCFCALLTVTSVATTASPGGSVVCAGTLESDQTSSNSVQKLQNLRDRFTGCHYIIGDVHLTRIDQRHFGPSDPPFNFTFLNSIREVTGCVKIVESCFSSPLEFPELRVIRGTGCGNSAASPALLLQFDPTCPLRTPHVAFPSLRVIKGDVTLYGVTSCYIERHINFTELFENPTVQRVVRMGDCSQLKDRCHDNCTIWPEDGKSRCWGPEKRHCQTRSRCRQHHSSAVCSHNLCFTDSRGSERCCSEQCLGGCFGSLPNQCYGCRRFDRNGTCVSSCVPEHYYDPGSAQMVKPNALKMLPYGPVCVAKCPESYFIERGSCVRKCTSGHTPNSEGICVLTETARLCELERDANSIVCSVGNPMLDGLTNSSLLCTEYHGSLTINLECIQSTTPTVKGLQPLTLDQLYTVFSRLKTFRGELQIHLIGDSQITNLTFLAPLERLDSQPGNSRSGSMVVIAPALQFLGLASLRYIGNYLILHLPAALVHAGSNVSTCTGFLPTEAAFEAKVIEQGTSGKKAVRLSSSLAKALNNSFYKSTCPYKPDSCDPRCEPRFGCWGPGPTSCVRCRSVKAGSACADTCESVPGWFDGGDAKSQDGKTERLCSQCHHLCTKCTGSGSGNCTACQTGAFRDGSSCVSECNRERQYADKAAGVCKSCPSVCVNLANGNATCTGNRTSVGPGGCQFCTQVMVLPDSNSNPTPVLKCVPSDTGCPQGYYAAVLDRGSSHLSNFSDFLALQKTTGVLSVSVCRKCASHCLSCRGSDVSCTACRFYSLDTGSPDDVKCEEKDSPRCRESFFPDHVTRTCRPCNSTCSSCSGPGDSDCLRCVASKYAMLTDPEAGVSNGSLTSTATLACVDTCPEERPHAVASQRGLLCSASPHGFLAGRPTVGDESAVAPLTALLLGLSGLSAAIVGLGLSVWCFLRRRRRPSADSDEDKEELEPILNRGYLATISENELFRGHEVGSGAFGTVYKGEWTPADGDGRKTTVAIKILADSGDHSLSGELLEESRIMASVDHPHCVRLVGICMTQPLQLVTQFMPLGNLRDFLRSRRDPPGQVGGAQLLRYAAQIASGMAYLERCNIIHRDLACRNVLVSSSRCVRITDFGLAKALDNASQEYQATGGKLPVKWLALESLVSRRFTHKSDVWAYGVTLWEIFTFGEPPYPNVKPQDLADYLEKGERLPQPAVCMLDVYMLMIKCWMLDDHHRPTFDELEANFTRMCGQPERYVFSRAARHLSQCSGASNAGRGGSGGHVSGGSCSKSPRHSNNNQRSSLDELDDAAYVAMGGDPEGNAGSDLDNDVFDETGGGSQTMEFSLTRRQLPQLPPTSPPPQHLSPPPPPPPLMGKQRSFSVAAGGRRRATGPPPPLVNNSQNQYTMDPCQPGSSVSDDYLLPVRAQCNPLPLPPRRSPGAAQSLSTPPPPPPPPPPRLTSPTIANPEYFFQQGSCEFQGSSAGAHGGTSSEPASSNDSGIASPKFSFAKE